MKKKIWTLLLVPWLCCLLIFNVGAEEQKDIPLEFDAVVEELPNEIAQQLPEGIWGDTAEQVDEALREFWQAESWIGLLWNAMGAHIGQASALLATLCGLLILSALFGTIRGALLSDGVGRVLGFCNTCVMFTLIIRLQWGALEKVSQYFERLLSLMGGMIPVMGTVWAMGGNVTTASSGSTTLYVFLSVCDGIIAKSVLPICVVSILLAICRSLSGLSFGGLSATIKRCYTFLLGLIMTVLLSVLGTQTTLGTAADSTGARAVKLLTSTVIPTVGGSVSETLRTVAAGVQYIKSVVGISGVTFLLLLTLPTLTSLLLIRLAFLLGSNVAEILGCETEKCFLAELGNAYGCIVAAVSMSSVMFLLAMTLFVRSTVAMI